MIFIHNVAVLVIALSILSGIFEGGLIKLRNSVGLYNSLDHKILTFRRTCIVGSAVFSMWVFSVDWSTFFDSFYWTGMLCCAILMSFTLFASFHRAFLNGTRDLNSCYIAYGNQYDELFLNLFNTKGWIISTHKISYKNPEYKKYVHKVGLIMYIFECVSTAILYKVAQWIS